VDLLGRVREELAFEANVRKSYLYRFLMEFQLWWPIWVIYLQRERGFSLTQITLLDVPFLLLVVLAEVPTGAIADRFGRRVSLMLGSSLFAVAVFIFGVADNYLIILTSYTVWGLALTFQSGADTAILYDSLKSAGRENDFQKINSRLWALRSLAVLIAILIGAPIAAATSFTFAITLSAIVGLAAVPVAFLMHEPRHREHVEAEPYFETVKTGLRDAWHQPPLRWIILFSGVLVAMTFTPLVFTQPFLDEQGIALGDLGLWQAPVRAAGVISALFAYQFVSRLGERASFFALPLLIVGALFALGGFNSLWAYGAFISIGLVAGMHHPTLATYVNRRIPSERRATMLSVQSLTGNLVMAGINPLAGILADTLGLQGMFVALGAITLVLGPGILLLWLRAERHAPQPEAEQAPAADVERERPSEVVPV
jgi:MFS family permease